MVGPSGQARWLASPDMSDGRPTSCRHRLRPSNPRDPELLLLPSDSLSYDGLAPAVDVKSSSVGTRPRPPGVPKGSI